MKDLTESPSKATSSPEEDSQSIASLKDTDLAEAREAETLVKVDLGKVPPRERSLSPIVSA